MVDGLKFDVQTPRCMHVPIETSIGEIARLHEQSALGVTLSGVRWVLVTYPTTANTHEELGPRVN